MMKIAGRRFIHTVVIILLYLFFLPPSVDGWMCEQCSARSEREFAVVLTLPSPSPPRKTKSINIGFVLYSQLRSRFLFRFSSRLLWAHCRLSYVHVSHTHSQCSMWMVVFYGRAMRTMVATATQIDAIKGLYRTTRPPYIRTYIRMKHLPIHTHPQLYTTLRS